MNKEGEVVVVCPRCTGSGVSCYFCEGIGAITAQLKSTPASSGWPQRIAAMDPWDRRRSPGHHICLFCEISRYRPGKDGGGRNEHRPDCLWQNAVDAGQHAKDAPPPAPEAAPAKPERERAAFEAGMHWTLPWSREFKQDSADAGYAWFVKTYKAKEQTPPKPDEPELRVFKETHIPPKE